MRKALALFFALIFGLMLWSDLRADGAATFAAKCQACHKADCTGNAAMPGTDLTKATGDCVQIVSDGKGKMPAYKGKLTDAEIQEVCTHIKSCGKK